VAAIETKAVAAIVYLKQKLVVREMFDDQTRRCLEIFFNDKTILMLLLYSTSTLLLIQRFKCERE
jgi:hypothetical protein